MCVSDAVERVRRLDLPVPVAWYGPCASKPARYSIAAAGGPVVSPQE